MDYRISHLCTEADTAGLLHTITKQSLPEPRVRPDVRPAPAGDAQPAGGAGGEEPPAVEVNNRLPGTENLVVPLASWRI